MRRSLCYLLVPIRLMWNMCVPEELEGTYDFPRFYQAAELVWRTRQNDHGSQVLGWTRFGHLTFTFLCSNGFL